MKSLLKTALPYPLITSARKAYHFGTARTCSCCGSSVRRFLDQGYGHPVLERLQVIGGMYKRDDRCPVCHASDRDRLVLFYLKRNVLTQAGPKLAILHFAPEKSISGVLVALDERIDYVAGDLEPERYYHLAGVMKLNLLAIDRPDASADVVICNHVLEHIVDDMRAMKEIFRVLKPGGVAILQTPISARLQAIIEGDGSESPETKIALYGQSDHVRIYTHADYVSRLETTGFAVEPYMAYDDDQDLALADNLNPFEMLYACRKPAA